MPQFDLNQFSSQIFWLVLCFAILYIYTIFYTVPRLNKIHQTRWQAIDGKIAHAQQLQDKCAQLTVRYQDELTAAQSVNQNKVNASIHAMNEQIHQQKLAIDHQTKTEIAVEKDRISMQMTTKANASKTEIEALACELTNRLLMINTNGLNQQREGASDKPLRDHHQGVS